LNKEQMKAAIESILPHRSPFLFISRIVSLEPGGKAVAEYDVPPDLPLFEGHFPQEPILPGVIIREMLAQSGALALLSLESMKGKVALLARIESARFKRPVRPGETLRAEMTMESMKMGIGRAEGTVYVGDNEAARAVIAFAVPN
jgi:3-hydroxyacyl-[acyl-carrier-protein] dehydratase